MMEAMALKFQSPFETHKLCVAPFLEKIQGFRSIPRVVQGFRAFDAQEVAPRMAPEKRTMHRIATNRFVLWSLAVNEATAINMGLKRHTIDDLNAVYKLFKTLHRQMSGCCDPYREHPRVEHTTHNYGKPPKDDWRITTTTETTQGPFNCCG